MAVRGLGCPVRFNLPQVRRAMQSKPPRQGRHGRYRLWPITCARPSPAKGALAVIPNNPSRALKYPLDKHLYAQRHLVECCFSKLKQFRRVATRFEKTARNYRAVVTLATIILRMR
jgi:transposase